MNDPEDRLDAAFDAARSVMQSMPNTDQILRAREQFLTETRNASLDADMRHSNQGSALPLELLSKKKEGETHMNRVIYQRKRMVAAVLLSIIIAGGLLTSPGLRSFAQSVIDIFVPAETDRRDDVYNPNSEVVPAVENEVAPQPRAADNPYPLTLDELQAQADFTVYTPTSIPTAYSFVGAEYIPETQLSLLHYECSAGNEVSLPLAIMQQQTDEPVGTMEVGASAEIIDVPIRDTVGQYVRGAWMLLLDEAEEGDAANMPRHWENNSDWQQLRWREAGFNFTVESGGSIGMQMAAGNPCILDETDFANVAQGLNLAQ